jgi:uncharacterized protein (TIGR00255 family)
MTGLGSAVGQGGGHRWTVELRSVNARGLDVRLRVPEGIEGLEKGLRDMVTGAVTRGNVSVSLRLARDDSAEAMRADPAKIEQVLIALAEIEAQAAARGMVLAQSSGVDVLGLRGILDSTSEVEAGPELLAAVLATAAEALAAFAEMRATEGAALAAILSAHVDEVERLTALAVDAAGARVERMRASIDSALATILEKAAADPARLETELALIAVKADVTEEIDRLRAHIEAARTLLATGGAIGRKLDFLTQEFNREANTLCSKAQSTELTRIGLDLKAVIDQMREQVQNVE